MRKYYFSVEVEDELLPVLKAITHAYALESIDSALRHLLEQKLNELRPSADDPLIGMISSGRGDLSERNEELLYGPRSDD